MPRAIVIWGAVLGVSDAVWLFQTSREQQRNAPQMTMALRVESRNRVCGVAALGKGMALAGAPRLASIAFWTQREV